MCTDTHKGRRQKEKEPSEGMFEWNCDWSEWRHPLSLWRGKMWMDGWVRRIFSVNTSHFLSPKFLLRFNEQFLLLLLFHRSSNGKLLSIADVFWVNAVINPGRCRSYHRKKLFPQKLINLTTTSIISAFPLWSNKKALQHTQRKLQFYNPCLLHMPTEHWAFVPMTFRSGNRENKSKEK